MNTKTIALNRDRWSRVLMTIAAVSALVLSLFAFTSRTALATHVTPEYVGGNPTCEDLGFSNGYSIDASVVQEGAHTYSNENGSITITSDGDKMHFSFSDADPAVEAVIVKAADGAYVYVYDPAATEDDGLITPNTSSNDPSKPQAGLSHFVVCFSGASSTPTPTESPSQTPSETPNGDTASLNIKKVNADDTSQNLNGAVFTVEGIPGTFTTGSGTYDKDGNPVPDGVNQARTRTGYFCIIGLPQDSHWLVTEVTPPAGFALADPASQTVSVDNDGDCDSSDAHFDNAPLASATPTETPEQTVAPTETPEQTVAPTETQEETVAAATGTPEQTVAAATGTPEGGVKAATGTPGASQPDTATGSIVGNNSVPTMLFALLLVLSLGGLAFLNVGSARKRS